MPEQVTSALLRERMRRMKPLRLPVGIYRDLLSTAYLSGDRSCVFRVIGSQDNLDCFLREWLPACPPPVIRHCWARFRTCPESRRYPRINGLPMPKHC